MFRKKPGKAMLTHVKNVIKGAENKEKFFKLIASIYPVYDWRYKLIESAYEDAKKAFEGKFRVDGERYFEHLRAVALIVIVYLRQTDHRMIIAALFHDIVEDRTYTGWTLEMVERKYGEEIALLVDWMTKPKDIFPRKEDYLKAYYERFERADRNPVILKLGDRLHNLLTMWVFEPDHIRRKIQETRRYFIKLAEQHCILIQELEAAMHVLETELDKKI